jgi:ATP-dependent DNA helicase 2 subunit 2
MSQELRENLRIFPAQVAFELYSQFQTKEVAARASYRGDFMINNSVGIQVLIFKKTTEEKLPSLKKYSTLAPFS